MRKERDRPPRTGVAYYEGYIHGARPFVLVITICALSDAAHSFSGRCARGCCISLHRESNRFVRFSLISAYHGNIWTRGKTSRDRAYRNAADRNVFTAARIICHHKSPGKVLSAKLTAEELFTRFIFTAR